MKEKRGKEKRGKEKRGQIYFSCSKIGCGVRNRVQKINLSPFSSDVSSADMSSIAARMWGKANAQSIKTIFFQRSDGAVVRFDRPQGGG